MIAFRLFLPAPPGLFVFPPWHRLRRLAFGTWAVVACGLCAGAGPGPDAPASRVLAGHSGSVLYLEFSPDGKAFFSSSRDDTVMQWEWPAGRSVRTIRDHAGDVYGAVFSPDGRLLATCGQDKTIRLREAGSLKELRVLEGHTDVVRAVAFSPDQNRLVSVSVDKTVRVWNVTTGRLESTLTQHAKRVKSVVYDPKGGWFATASSDQTVRVWDAATGGVIAVLEGHTGDLETLAVSPDGTLLASSSGDTTIRLWDTGTWRTVRVLAGHTAEVNAVAFSPDGRLVASGSVDQTIRIWDSRTGMELHSFVGHSVPGASKHGGYVEFLAFSPDGSTLVTGGGGGDSAIKCWDLSALGLLAGDSARWYFPSCDDEWQRIAPERAGWDGGKLDEALDYAGMVGSSSVVILQQGRILAMRRWEPAPTNGGYARSVRGKDPAGNAIEDTASVQKSIVSLLVGIARHGKLVGLDDPVQKHLGAGWSKVSPAQEGAIAVRHLLTMTSGLTDDLRYEAPPGTVWRYNDAAYQRIISILEAATGVPIADYSRRVLTDRVGIVHSGWKARPGGSARAGNPVGYATTGMDLARIGLLVLAGGRWGSEAVLPDAANLEEALRPSQEMNPSYGQLWWLNGQKRFIDPWSHGRNGPWIESAPPDLVAAFGASDRRLYIVPSLGLVVVRLGAATKSDDFDREFWRLLMAARGGGT